MIFVKFLPIILSSLGSIIDYFIIPFITIPIRSLILEFLDVIDSMFQFVIRFFLTFLKLHFLFNSLYFLIQPNFLTVIPIRSLVIKFLNLFDPIFPILILFFTRIQKFTDLLNIFSDLKFHFLLN